jgi:hypothetical protein
MAGTVITAAINNINIVNGTAVIDVAAGVTVDANANLTISNATTLTGSPYTPAGTDVAVTDGGTGASTLADGGLVVGAGTAAVEVVADVAVGSVLVSGGVGANPAYSANPTVTSVLATTFDTNVTTAGVTLAGTTLAADGTDAAIDINLTPKGTGEVNITKVDIDAGTIDGATIATSNITVGSGKTLDVSAGTLTLAADQISGDKVEGGTINATTITTLTSTTANVTTLDTNVAAAGVTLSGTTLAADGTDAAISINITPKGTGSVVISKVDINAGEITGITDIVVADGGTGVSTLADGGLLVGAAAAAIEVIATPADGTAILVSGASSGANPVWTTATGSGAPVRATSPTLVTPLLGTPTSGVLTNCTGLPQAAVVGLTTADGPSWAHAHLTDAIADNLSTNQAATTAFVQRALYLNAPVQYGITWDESADTYTRTGKTAGYPCGKTLSDALLPIQSKMRRCVINNAGVVQYYLFHSNSALKEDGITASVLDGSAGQVMVEIPKFWYRHIYAGTSHIWEVSPIALDGFDVHPAFMSGATELNYIYIGAYEGVLFDTSTGLYDDYASGDVLDFTATTGDVLSSVSGKIPVTNGTRANFRAIAANRGTGWTQELYDIRSACQLLYLTEYASFNSQSMIGLGICNVNDWAATSYYPFAHTGNSNAIGNASGNTAGAVAGTASEHDKYMSYRGIEQWYGHLYKWLDGINTKEKVSCVCNVAASLVDMLFDSADSMATFLTNNPNYTSIGITNKADDGYQNTLLNISRGFLPANTADANAATKITDGYYQNTGWRVAISGGDAVNALSDGGFCLNLSSDSAFLHASVGARVCFRK